MSRFLDVSLSGHLVGELEQDDSGALFFRYSESWLESENAEPLSASLPLGPEGFKRNSCRPFFAGLLPEEESRRLVAKAFGVSARNDFALLSKIGGECAGAVSMIPRGEPLRIAERKYEALSLEQLEGKFQSLPSRPLLAGEKGMRLSLAGAQGKLAVMIKDGRYHLSLDGSASSHILKPESLSYSDLVQNEFFCMRLAKQAGLEVAEVELQRAGEIDFLQVTRYDRFWDKAGDIERIHQEDFCQAMGIVPELKYQQEGGPSFKKCFALVRAVSVRPGPDLLRFFDAVIFNFLIGNNDAHGKNFSFIRQSQEARMAPLYDLVCTQLYADLDDEMAMKVGGSRKPKRLTARNWNQFFQDAGLSEKAASQRARAMKERVTEALSQMELQNETEHLIRDVIHSNLELFVVK